MMRRRSRIILRIVLLAASLGAAAEACFSPVQPPCTFACGPGGACPENYTCASDGLCHRADGQGQCDLTPGADASTD